MEEVGLLKEENGFLYSPFQRIMMENKLKNSKEKQDINDIKVQLEGLRRINQRLEDKVEFLKNKPKLKKVLQ